MASLAPLIFIWPSGSIGHMKVRLSQPMFATMTVGLIFSPLGALMGIIGVALMLFGADRSGPASFIGIIFAAIGAIFAAAGIPMATIALVKRNHLQKLVAKGYVIQAQVVDVRLQTSVMVNDQHPWQIVCHWQDPNTFQVYEFVGPGRTDYPFTSLAQWNLAASTLPIYLNPNNLSDYYIDDSSLTTFRGMLR
jgi:hypothetical protein